MISFLSNYRQAYCYGPTRIQFAVALQTKLLKVQNLGPYDKVANSCVSHVWDVLGAKGVRVPPAQGSAQLRFLLETVKKAKRGTQ